MALHGYRPGYWYHQARWRPMSGEGPWITVMLNYDGGDEVKMKMNVEGAKEVEMQTNGKLQDAITEAKDRAERRCRRDGVTARLQVTVSYHETETSMDTADLEQAHVDRDSGGESEMSESGDWETDVRTSPDRALRDLKERIRREAPLRWVDQTNDGGSDVRGEPVATEPQEALKTSTSSGRREATRRRSPEYERRDTIAGRHRDDWRESSRDSYWRDRDRDNAPPRRVFDPQTGESHPLPYESKDRYIITHKASEPPTFRGYGITEYLEKWELHASRSQWSEEEIIENFLFNMDPSLDREVKEARPKDGKWTTYKKNLVELYKLEDNKYFIKDLETMTQDEDESVRAFGMRFQKISDVLMKKGKISEVERCTIFIGHLSKEVLKLAIKAEADDYKDLVWKGMKRRDFSLYKEYVTDRCPDFKDYPWSEKNEAVAEEVKEIRDMVKGLTKQRSGRDGYRGGRYEREDRNWERRDGSRGREDRRNDSRGRNERGGYGVSSEPYSKSPDPKAARSSISRSADDRPSTPRNSCVYCRGEDHIKRDCPDLKRAIDEALVVLDDRKYVKWADGLGDVLMFPSMKENVEARRVKPSKEKEPVRSQSIKITFEGDMATTPIRVAATTSKKTDTDYVMAEKDGQRVDGEEVILSPRKRGVKKFLMKMLYSGVPEAASKPARDELQMITRKTRIPLSEEGRGAPKAEASTIAVTGVTARADRMTTVLLDGMKGVPPDKFYIFGSGAVETIINDGAVLDAVIDNGSEAVIIDEDLAVQVGLGLDRSYLFEIETADGRKQQITGVYHKAAIEVQGVRVTLPVFAIKNCSSDLLLGRTWLSHVHAVTIERPDGSQTLSIKKPDGTRVMIETVEPRDPRNRAALAVDARPSDQIKSSPISGRAVRFREKKYGPLLTEEERRIVEVEDLGSRLIKEKNEVIAFLKEKMVSHVAEPSDRAYANRWFFLRKLNGKIRWIQDLQKVNEVTIRDVGSVPHADLLAEGATAGALPQ
uniref:CCHC-type domain-containing protein n=1 Tax=Chara braunii TaxID=69332 RepID=A0A388LF10_CHABU